MPPKKRCLSPNCGIEILKVCYLMHRAEMEFGRDQQQALDCA